MTNEKIAELRSLLAKATPGPWERVDTPDYAEVRAPGLYSPVALVGSEHDVALVCAMHDALPALLDAIEGRRG